ncbi:hypothetical protein SY83_13195 [Paenibacillus swuensis]|uniref:Tyrosine-protein phosphatase n=1 Tax=Paenibacillus swuensis TaxID=1178515 RepID=A0A172TJC0_9BACL|nr:CpsB/CapC family capsule biosynthesis tyrosine phosphatase [Paenibacillus swuensis]ANE47062.1 hypothetical protein SY83_13195 [Paenibacillus swuensis]
MIDIHTHILPGVDDGAQVMEDAMNMAEAAFKDGIRTLIATPHHANGTYWNEADAVSVAVETLNLKLQERAINLTILPGQEVRVYDALLDDLDAGKVRTLNGSRYILLEFSSARIPRNISELMHELRIMGITPVIAHPERNAEISAEPDKLQRLVEDGALAQITTHSLLGGFGDKIQKVSYDLCRSNLIHFVSSDAHNLTHRPFRMTEAYAGIAARLGDTYVEYYKQNAQLLAGNEDIEAWPIKQAASSKGWFKFWK